MSDKVHTGSVKWYSAEKGFGFIQAEGFDKDIFMHIKQLRASGINGLIDGEKVKFTCNNGPKGLFATNISRTNGSNEHPMPPVSERQRRAMRAAESGNSTIGIPKSVGKEFSDADPGGKLPMTKKKKGYDRSSHHKGNPGFPSTDSSSPPGLNEMQTTTEQYRDMPPFRFTPPAATDAHTFNVGHKRDGNLRNSGISGAHRIGKRK